MNNDKEIKMNNDNNAIDDLINDLINNFKFKSGKWNNAKLSKFYGKNLKFMSDKKDREPLQYLALCLGAVAIEEEKAMSKIEEDKEEK